MLMTSQLMLRSALHLQNRYWFTVLYRGDKTKSLKTANGKTSQKYQLLWKWHLMKGGGRRREWVWKTGHGVKKETVSDILLISASLLQWSRWDEMPLRHKSPLQTSKIRSWGCSAEAVRGLPTWRKHFWIQAVCKDIKLSVFTFIPDLRDQGCFLKAGSKQEHKTFRKEEGLHFLLKYCSLLAILSPHLTLVKLYLLCLPSP